MKGILHRGSGGRHQADSDCEYDLVALQFHANPYGTYQKGSLLSMASGFAYRTQHNYGSTKKGLCIGYLGAKTLVKVGGYRRPQARKHMLAKVDAKRLEHANAGGSTRGTHGTSSRTGYVTKHETTSNYGTPSSLDTTTGHLYMLPSPFNLDGNTRGAFRKA